MPHPDAWKEDRLLSQTKEGSYPAFASPWLSDPNKMSLNHEEQKAVLFSGCPVNVCFYLKMKGEDVKP